MISVNKGTTHFRKQESKQLLSGSELSDIQKQWESEGIVSNK